MALIVEDGTGVPGANSYASVAYADSYFNARLNQVWGGLLEPQKEAALILGTDYINARWGRFLRGKKTVEDQPLEFPRDIYGDEMPNVLLAATCEYAVRASQTSLFPDPLVDETGYQITGKTEKVGPIEEKTTYAYEGPGSTMRIWLPYPYPDSLMRSLLTQIGNRVIRN